MASPEQIHKEIKKYVNKKLVRGAYLFFNIMLHKFHWELDYHCPPGSLAYVHFKNKDINDLADGTIWISSKLIQEPSFTSKNYLFILIHELFHIIFQHNTRRGNRDPLIWNLAADHLINSLIKREFKEDLQPPYGWDHIFLAERLPWDAKTTEEIYDLLIQEKDRYEIVSTTQLGGGSGKGDDQDSQGGSATRYRIRDKKTGKEFEITVSHNESGAEEEFGRTVSNIYNSIKDRGLLGSHLTECFNQFFDSTLPWQEVLRNVIRKSTIPTPNERGWRTLNKLFLPHGFTLPGIIYDDSPRYGICILSIDTSGSIDSSELQEFANILVESVQYFRQVWLISHDAEVTQVKTFNHGDFNQIKNFIKTEGFKGRGGTSHKCVFDKIQELQEKESEKVSIYLGLTDGYSDISESWNSNRWSSRNEIPTYFIITTHGHVPSIANAESKNPKSIILR